MRVALFQMRNFQLSLLICISTVAGCGRENKVRHVSLEESGVIIRRGEWKLSPSDWNAWRGRNQDGRAEEGEVPLKWSETENVRWRSEISGRGHGSPIVIGDAVFLATADDEAQTQSVICIDRGTGAPRWQTVLHEGGFPVTGSIHEKSSNANGTIACDGSQLFIAMLNNNAIMVTALDLAGEIVWQREAGEFESRFGYGPSPILYESLVIIAADHVGGGYLAALDNESGQLAWRVARGGADSYSTPTVNRVGGRDQLLISGNDAVTSYDPQSGDLLWQTDFLKATCGTIVSDGQRVFASGGYPDSQTICLSAEGKELWSNNVKSYEPSLLLVNEKLLTVNDSGVAICWDAKSGHELWKKRLGGNFSASPVLVNDTVFVPNLKGETFVFQAGSEYVPVSKNVLGDDCYASPAISDRQIFLRIGVAKGTERAEQLVCIESNSD